MAAVASHEVPLLRTGSSGDNSWTVFIDEVDENVAENSPGSRTSDPKGVGGGCRRMILLNLWGRFLGGAFVVDHY